MQGRFPMIPRPHTERFSLRPLFLLPLALVLVTADPAGRSLLAQAPEEEAPTTTLLRRVVEAADGHRTGELVWVVLDAEFPHDVAGVFIDPDSARAVADSLDLRLEGPVRTVTDTEDGDPGMTIGCHLDDSTPIQCLVRRNGEPIELPFGIDPTIRYEDIDRIVVQVYRDEGLFTELEFRNTDAIFFTNAAIEKFLLPYIVRAYGLEVASDYRARLDTFLREREIQR